MVSLLALAMVLPPLGAAADPLEDNLTKMMFSKAAAGTPVIDGTKDAAYDSTATLAPGRWKNGKVSEVQGQFNVLWDGGNLYVYANVQDTLINTANLNTWERDSIEVFIEEDNGRKDVYGPGDHQIRIMADGALAIKSASNLLAPGDVTVAHQLTGTGYIIEAKIPLKITAPVNGKKIGFDLQINDADEGANRSGLIGWNDFQDYASLYPKNMGQLQLVTGPTANSDTVLIDYPPLGPAIPPVDFSSRTVVQEGQVQLQAYESTAPLLNPNKGWVLYGDTANWGRPNLQTAETLALGTIGYYRYNWYEIEPQEGQYNWAIIDGTIAAWDALGKKFAFGVINANTARPSIRYVTPKWVEDAGAQFIEADIEFNLDASVHGSQMIPVWNDPIYVEKLDQFIEALGNRYNHDPRVEFIDIRSYGNYGEGHVWGLSESPDPARRSQLISDEELQTYHIDTYRRHFPDKQLILPKGSLTHEAVLAAVPDQGIGLRFDAAVTGYPYHLAQASVKTPTVYEFVGSYAYLKGAGSWSDYAFYKNIPQGNPSFIGMGQYAGDAALFLKEKEALIAEAANLMGYHFVLNDIVVPQSAAAGSEISVILNWANKGFAPIYRDTHVALALLNTANQIVGQPYWLDELDAKQWLPRIVSEEQAEITLASAPAGNYKLAVGLFADKNDATPLYKLGNRSRVTSGWYVVSDQVLVSGNTYTFDGIEEQPVSVVIRNAMQAYDEEPVVSGGKVLVPLKPTFEALGVAVAVYGSTVTVTPDGGAAFELAVGAGGVSITGGVLVIEGDAIPGYLPVNADWDSESRTLTIVDRQVEPEYMASQEWRDSAGVLREARLAFDGNLNTSWVANAQASTISEAAPVWVQRNYAQPVTFNSVSITEHAGATAGEIGNFKLQYWDDGVWQDAYTGTKVSTGSKGDTYTFQFAPVITTKFRLLVTSATVGFVNVREIALSLSQPEPEYMASHEWRDSVGVLREARLAFDGNLSTSWVADKTASAVSEAAPVWVQRNYAEPVTFSSVSITEHAGATAGEIGNFKLQYWNDGVWQDAYTGAKVSTGSKGDTYTFQFAPVTTTKFRLLVTSATVGYVNVRSIELME
jgi:hypothetical protein